MSLPCALTIAGSDSCGGAGIQADLRTFAALEVYGASAIAAVTSQNTLGVRSALALEPALVVEQIDAVLDDLPVAAIKTGMLSSRALVEAIVAALRARAVAVPLVVDPVMISKSGHALLDDDAVAALKALLLPRATLVTPNLPEAERLVGFPVRTIDDQESAAQALVGLGARAALVKGGHAAPQSGAATVLVDVLFDGRTMSHLSSPRVDTPHTHGTGCTYSAAITALLARAVALPEAVTRAHAFVAAAIQQAPGLGHGHGPVHHMHPWYRA